MILPFLLMILHLSQIFLTEGLTFIVLYLSFQKIILLFSPSDTAFGKVVNRDFNGHGITGENFDIIHAKFAGNMCGHNMAVRQLYLENGIRKCFKHYAVLKFDHIVLRQKNPSLTVIQNLILFLVRPLSE